VQGERGKEQGKNNFEFLILNFELRAKEQGQRFKVEGTR
jgi:hypothetical protein